MSRNSNPLSLYRDYRTAFEPIAIAFENINHQSYTLIRGDIG
jgi:hypothetical protein